MDPTDPEGVEGAGAERPPAGFRLTRPLHKCDTVGKLIVYYRELKGWSQKQLRQVLGMKQGRLSSLERDTRKPSFEEIERIALFLGRTPNWLSVLHRAAVRQLAGAH